MWEKDNMKSAALIILGAFAMTAAMPATAQHVSHGTTVTKVKGPLKLLPHHKRKYCKTRWVNHRRVKKCWYH